MSSRSISSPYLIREFLEGVTGTGDDQPPFWANDDALAQPRNAHGPDAASDVTGTSIPATDDAYVPKGRNPDNDRPRPIQANKAITSAEGGSTIGKIVGRCPDNSDVTMMSRKRYSFNIFRLEPQNVLFKNKHLQL